MKSTTTIQISRNDGTSLNLDNTLCTDVCSAIYTRMLEVQASKDFARSKNNLVEEMNCLQRIQDLQQLVDWLENRHWR